MPYLDASVHDRRLTKYALVLEVQADGAEVVLRKAVAVDTAAGWVEEQQVEEQQSKQQPRVRRQGKFIVRHAETMEVWPEEA